MKDLGGTSWIQETSGLNRLSSSHPFHPAPQPSSHPSTPLLPHTTFHLIFYFFSFFYLCLSSSSCLIVSFSVLVWWDPAPLFPTLSFSSTDNFPSLSPFLSLVQLLSVSFCFFHIAPIFQCWLFFLLIFILTFFSCLQLFWLVLLSLRPFWSSFAINSQILDFLHG